MVRPGLGAAIFTLLAVIAILNVVVFAVGFALEQARHRHRTRRLRHHHRPTIELRHGRLVRRTYAQDRRDRLRARRPW